MSDVTQQITAAQGERFGGRVFLAGDRVFDTVRGLEAVVVPPPVQTKTPVDFVYVQYADGSSLPRHPDQLIYRPAPPVAE